MISGLAALWQGTASLAVPKLSGATITLGPADAVSSFPGTTIDRLDPATEYVGGQFVEELGSGYPRDLFSGTTNLTLTDGTRTGLGGGISFSTDANKFQYLTLATGASSLLYVYVDGRLLDAASPIFPADGSLRYVTIDLSGAEISPGFHDIQVISYEGSYGGLVVPTGAHVRSVESNGPRIVFLGDSFTEGAGAEAVQQGYVPITGALLGSSDVWKSGFGGTGYERPLGNRPDLQDRILSDGVNAHGDIYVVAMGLNDDNESPTLRDSIFQTLSTLSMNAPNAKIFVLGYWNPFLPGQDYKPDVRDAIRDAVEQLSNLVFLDPLNVSFTKADPTHPDAAGHLVLAQWLTAQIRDSMGADGLVDQNVVGDVVGPMFVEGWRPTGAHTLTVLENGRPSERFEIVDTDSPFPLLRLKADQSVAAMNAITLDVVAANSTGHSSTHTISVAVRQRVVGRGNDDAVFATGNQVRIEGLGGNDVLYGTDGADLIDGGPGNDLLHGLGGADKMSGGAGNDSYYIDTIADIVVEQEGGGEDTIYSSLDASSLQDNVENLWLVGAAVSGGGNGAANRIFGNASFNMLYGWAGVDYLDGGSGDDELDGGDGSDTINGGAGSDRMSGGQGDDAYYVDNLGDLVVEGSNQGYDTIYSYLAAYTLAADAEELFLIDASALDGTGNESANRIFGNGRDNNLEGLGGNDYLDGGAGSDVLDGGMGDDMLNGGKSGDAMRGGAGADTYYVDDALDAVLETLDEGNDTVWSYRADYALADNVEDLFIMAGASSGSGNALDNRVFGNARANSLYGLAGNDYLDGGDDSDQLYAGPGNDVLQGGAGADSMVGGTGDDLYYLDISADQILEDQDEGSDAAYTSSNIYLLPGNVEHLAFIGNGNFVGEGNNADNSIYGSAGDDTLVGAGGTDFLFGNGGSDHLIGGAGKDYLFAGTGSNLLEGGAGDDVYYVDSSSDMVTERDEEGSDAVYTSLATFKMPDEVEGIYYTGSANFSGEGGASRDAIWGADGNDVLSGRDGDDVLGGNGGSDILIGGAGLDVLFGGAGADVFVFETEDDISSDLIVDFSNAQGDRIDVSQLAANGSLPGGSLAWIGSNPFTGNAGELRFQVVDGNVQLMSDLDGNGAADFTITLQGNSSLSAGDLIL